VIQFRKGQRKDDIAAEQRRKFTRPEGVVFIGKAQEKMPVFRTERRRNETTGATYPWLVRSTAMVNQFYIYCVDQDFGPFFLKFSSYFPYTAKLCINGHEYAKQQLAKKNIGFEALDNGVLSCDDPQRLQAICTDSMRKKSMHCCVSGCGCCRIPTLRATVKRDTVIRLPFSRPSSP
jgi:hypothetical protein